MITTNLRNDRIAWSFPGLMFDFSEEKKASWHFIIINVLKYQDVIESANDTAAKKSHALPMDAWRSMVDGLNNIDSRSLVALERTYMALL